MHKDNVVLFISVQRPYDPIEIVEKIVSNSKASGVSRTRYIPSLAHASHKTDKCNLRFIQRLTPTIVSTQSNSPELVSTVSAPIIKSVFYAYAEKTQNPNISVRLAISSRILKPKLIYFP